MDTDWNSLHWNFPTARRLRCLHTHVHKGRQRAASLHDGQLSWHHVLTAAGSTAPTVGWWRTDGRHGSHTALRGTDTSQPQGVFIYTDRLFTPMGYCPNGRGFGKHRTAHAAASDWEARRSFQQKHTRIRCSLCRKIFVLQQNGKDTMWSQVPTGGVGQRATFQPRLPSPNRAALTEILLVWGPQSASQKVKDSFLCIRCHYTPFLHSFEGKSFAFLQYQNVMKPKTTHVFKVCTSSNEEMRRDAYCHEKNNRLKAMFKISNLTVFIYGLGHAKEEFHNQSEELPGNRARLK